MSLPDFFHRYFVEPIDLGIGYNPVNTLAYAILFVLVAYLVYEFLKKMKIKPDKRFLIAIMPWVIFGIFIRVMEDAKILTGYIFITPNIWILFTLIISSFLAISCFLEKKYRIPYFKIMFVSGIILISMVLPFIKIRNIEGLFYTMMWFIPWLIILKMVRWSKENKLVTSLHLFDSTTTFVSLQYFQYFEQHVLPRAIIDITGSPFSFVVVKVIVIVFVLKTLDKYSDDKKFTNYLKIAIGLLGFITGLRDLLRLISMV